MKSQCHTGMKLAPVRVFACKHPRLFTERKVLLRSLQTTRAETKLGVESLEHKSPSMQ